MSRYKIVVIRCNGCGRTNFHDGIEIVNSKEFSFSGEWSGTIVRDICLDCANQGKYICHYCREVHDDENLCEKSRLEK